MVFVSVDFCVGGVFVFPSCDDRSFARLDFLRAALFLWRIFFLAARSIAFCSFGKTFLASAIFFSSISFRYSFMSSLKFLLVMVFRFWRVFVCFTRLIADFIIGMGMRSQFLADFKDFV